jgi:5-methylcytosine-specific restriction endonuclease McrA
MSLRTYTDESFIQAVQNNKSIAGVLRELDLVAAGGNYESIKKKIRDLCLNTDHFTGQAWMPKGTQIKLFDDLKHPGTIKNRLIEERGHKCESCKNTLWLGKLITLELDHINGDRQNNSRDNLRLLCPNCHAMTPTYRGKNIGEKAKNNRKAKIEEIYGEKNKNKTHGVLVGGGKKIYSAKDSCIDCQKLITKKSKTGRCFACHSKTIRRVPRPDINELVSEIRQTSFLAVARKYGVSDNAIRKWLISGGVDPKTLC